jgi:hypothetical protein
LIINQLALSENALKLTYGNVEFQNFRERTPDSPLQWEGKGRIEGTVEERRGERRGTGCGEVGMEGLQERERMERGEN